MKKVVLCINILTILSIKSIGSTYYIANTGVDNYPGTEAQPLKTIKAGLLKAKAGDILYLKRGDIFREETTLTASGLSIQSYGDQSKARPDIRGSIRLSSWTRTAGKTNVWETPCTKKVWSLFVNDQLMTLARYPNKGWLHCKNLTNTLDSNAFMEAEEGLQKHVRSTTDYWKGSTVRFRRHSWWFESRPVLAYDGAIGRLTVKYPRLWLVYDAPGNGWGFYIDNNFSELDTAGEWYQDLQAGKIYLWAPGNVDPNTIQVEGTVYYKGMNTRDVSVADISFSYFGRSALSINGKSTVSRCTFKGVGSDSGGEALSIGWDSYDTRVSQCLMKNCLNNGISITVNSANKNIIVEEDTLRNIGSFPGYGGSGVWHASGAIIYAGKGIVIQNSLFDTIGYSGIILGAEGNTVKNNVLKNAMFTLNDGAAIYTNCHRSIIKSNVILYTKGNLESSGPWANLGHGIWPEFLSDFRESVIDSNVCISNGGYGIFLSNNFADTLRGNICFNNGRAQIELSGEKTNASTNRTTNLPQGNLLKDNQFISGTKDQHVILYRPDYVYGTMQNNYLISSFTDSCLGEWSANDGWNITKKTVPYWQNSFASWSDKTCKTTPIKRPSNVQATDSTGIAISFINETSQLKQFSLGKSTFLNPDGTEIKTTIDVKPYYARILLYKTFVPTTTKIAKVNPGFFFTKRYDGTKCSLTFYSSKSGSLQLKIMNLQGKIVLTSKEEIFIGKMTKSFNLKPGYYVVHYSFHGGSLDVYDESRVFSLTTF